MPVRSCTGSSPVCRVYNKASFRGKSCIVQLHCVEPVRTKRGKDTQARVDFKKQNFTAGPIAVIFWSGMEELPSLMQNLDLLLVLPPLLLPAACATAGAVIPDCCCSCRLHTYDTPTGGHCMIAHHISGMGHSTAQHGTAQMAWCSPGGCAAGVVRALTTPAVQLALK